MLSRLTATPLPPHQIDEILEKKLSWLVPTLNPERIYLFGSAANYAMTNASDVDLIVVLSDEFERSPLMKKLYQNRPKDDWPQDLILLSQKEFDNSVAKGGGVCWLACREGKIVYQRESNDT